MSDESPEQPTRLYVEELLGRIAELESDVDRLEREYDRQEADIIRLSVCHINWQPIEELKCPVRPVLFDWGHNDTKGVRVICSAMSDRWKQWESEGVSDLPTHWCELEGPN